MGTKPSSNYQSDRPESGGADRKGERENNRLLELEKERLAVEKSKEEKPRSSDTDGVDNR